MDCEKVRDRFSSLWEKELTPFEERAIKEHLSSCPACQKEFEQFEKTMQWLQAVEDVEVPDGFLPGVYKKMEERKEITSAGKSGKKWLGLPLPLKLPAQAVAMVAVVFLVLYLTKMMPMRAYHPKETGQPSPPVSLEKKPEKVSTPSQVKKDRGNLKIAAGAPHPKEFEQAETAAKRKESSEAYPSQMKVEAKKIEEPAPKTEGMALRLSKPGETAGAPSPGLEKIEKEASMKAVSAAKPSQEIVLKTSDREKAVSQLYKLAKQFGGEIISTEGDKCLASLPQSSFPQFEKELAGLSSSAEADNALMRGRAMERAESPSPHQVKKEDVEAKAKEPATLATHEESRIIVRIVLVHE